MEGSFNQGTNKPISLINQLILQMVASNTNWWDSTACKDPFPPPTPPPIPHHTPLLNITSSLGLTLGLCLYSLTRLGPQILHKWSSQLTGTRKQNCIYIL